MEIFFNFSCLFIDRSSFLIPRIHTFPAPQETSMPISRRAAVAVIYSILESVQRNKQKTKGRGDAYSPISLTSSSK